MAFRFGCARCMPDSAEAAWNARQALERGPEIADESHFHVAVLRCHDCGQSFATVFCEKIDWVGGNDPQDWLLIPLTDSEADVVARAGENGAEGALRSLPGRRYLLRWYPSDAEAPGERWIDGPIRLPPHD